MFPPVKFTVKRSHVRKFIIIVRFLMQLESIHSKYLITDYHEYVTLFKLKCSWKHTHI